MHGRRDSSDSYVEPGFGYVARALDRLKRVLYHATARECGLTADECVLLARNSLEATFAAPEEKAALVAKLRAYCEAFSA